ncbi:MAG: hypothetical protein HY828_16295 [Actinobacteria bacterium]|nr:hypothetical protein [Actinomycetota bacterium]
MKAGRTIGTAVVGFLFTLFLAIDLVLFGVVALDSAVITVLLAVGLVGGGVLGWLAAGRHPMPVTPAPADAVVPPPPPGPPPPPPPM